MGKSICISEHMYKTVFLLLDGEFVGVELAISKSKKPNTSYIRVKNIENNISCFLKKKDINNYYNYIKDNESIKVIEAISVKFPFLQGQVKNNNDNNGCGSYKDNAEKGNLILKENGKDESKNDSDINDNVLNEGLLKIVNGTFNSGKLTWEKDTKCYSFSYPIKNKKSKSKRKNSKIMLSKSISSEINSLTNMDCKFFEIIENLKSNYSFIEKDIINFYITPDCYIDENNEYKPIKELKKKIVILNSLYVEPLFELRDFGLFHNNKEVKRTNFINILRLKDRDLLADGIANIFPSFIDKMEYIEIKELEDFFDLNSKDDIEYMERNINNLKTIALRTINFVISNYHFFYETGFYKKHVNDVLSFKQNIDKFSLKISKYHKNIKLEFGPFEFLYNYKKGRIYKESFLNEVISEVICNLVEVTKSKIVNKYYNITKNIKPLKENVYIDVLDNVIEEFKLADKEIKDVEDYIKDSLKNGLDLKVYIKEGKRIYINSECVSDLSEEELKCVLEEIYKEGRDYFYSIGKAYILEKRQEYKRIEDILTVPQNNLIVSCISDLDKKGITTYTNILIGKKHVDKDDEYFGKLNGCTYDFVLGKIKNLIEENVLSVLYRRASFGVYESIEVRDSVKIILGKINKCDSKEYTFDVENLKEDDIECTLTEFLEKSNNLKNIKENLILKTIEIDDIRLLVDVFLSGISINKNVILDMKNIMSKCNALSKETILFIRLKQNMVKKPSLKAFLNEILTQNDLKKEG